MITLGTIILYLRALNASSKSRVREYMYLPIIAFNSRTFYVE